MPVNPQSAIRNPQSRTAALSMLLVCFLASCTGGGWNEDQRGVYAAMQAWSASASKGELETLWSMLTPDAQQIYERELTGIHGVRMTVKLDKAALAPDALTPPEERRKAEARLKMHPDEPDKLSAREYYIWRVKRELTPQSAANTARLFARENIKDIEVKGDSATVVLHHGDPGLYYWKKVKGDWKFDVRPSILHALESVRRREAAD
jgi:hypothetical protein